MAGIGLISVSEQSLEPTVRVASEPMQDSIGIITVYSEEGPTDQDMMMAMAMLY
jgi:hypothetical protein